jgi:polynucleotide 5'-kinase involved in rRNA processing
MIGCVNYLAGLAIRFGSIYLERVQDLIGSIIDVEGWLSGWGGLVLHWINGSITLG